MPRDKVYILTPTRSARAKYIFDWVFTHQLGLDWEFTDEKVEGSTIFYNGDEVDGEVCIPTAGLLDQKSIYRGKPPVGKVKDLTVLFPRKEQFPFDIFSAAFFMLSRMEEYQDFAADRHGRFSAACSLAYAEGFLEQPVVDEWVLFFKEQLKAQFPDLRIRDSKYSFHVTLDIDRAFLFKYKSFVRFAGGAFKSFFKGNLKEVVLRKLAWFGLMKDPNDTFDELQSIFEHYQLKPWVFFLVGKPGLFDENLPLNHPALQKVIKETQQWAYVSWHPSYGASGNLHRLKAEKNEFESFLNQKVEVVRHHFLKISIPETYRHLHQLGIKEDHSMAFADRPGFRAGTSHKFPFFDVEKNCATPLIIVPFALMDTTFTTYLKRTPDDCLRAAGKIIDAVKNVNGRMEILWHNETLNNLGPWKGWKNVLGQVIERGKL